MPIWASTLDRGQVEMEGCGRAFRSRAIMFIALPLKLILSLSTGLNPKKYGGRRIANPVLKQSCSTCSMIRRLCTHQFAEMTLWRAPLPCMTPPHLMPLHLPAINEGMSRLSVHPSHIFISLCSTSNDVNEYTIRP
jgi:hypothetical protein